MKLKNHTKYVHILLIVLTLTSCVITPPYVAPLSERKAIIHFDLNKNINVALTQFVWLDSKQCTQRKMVSITPEEIKSGKNWIEVLADKEIAIGYYYIYPEDTYAGYGYTSCSFLFSFTPENDSVYVAKKELGSCSLRLTKNIGDLKADIVLGGVENLRMRESIGDPRTSEIACEE